MERESKRQSFAVAGNVRLRIFQLGDGRWRFAYDSDGAKRYVTGKDREKVEARALELAAAFASGSEAPLAPSELAEFRRWKAARGTGQALVVDLVGRYIESLASGRGRSAYYLRNQKQDLSRFSDYCGPKMAVGAIAPDFVRRWLASRNVGARRRRNLHVVICSFLSWCRRNGELPEGLHAGDRVERPRVEARTPETIAPSELEAVMREIHPDFVPWAALLAFGGLRSEECCPEPRSGKDCLRWQDIDFGRGILLVRPEVSKTGRKRLACLSETLAAWLAPVRAADMSAPVCVQRRADYQPDSGVSETQWLGAVLGLEKWPRNCLRHSFISYRAAIAGLGRAALEAGNSESIAAKAYNDAQSPDDAQAWFSMTPSRVGRIWPTSQAPARSRKLLLAMRDSLKSEKKNIGLDENKSCKPKAV